jgi:hypothetical protein
MPSSSSKVSQRKDFGCTEDAPPKVLEHTEPEVELSNTKSATHRRNQRHPDFVKGVGVVKPDSEVKTSVLPAMKKASIRSATKKTSLLTLRMTILGELVAGFMTSRLGISGPCLCSSESRDRK